MPLNFTAEIPSLSATTASVSIFRCLLLIVSSHLLKNRKKISTWRELYHPGEVELHEAELFDLSTRPDSVAPLHKPELCFDVVNFFGVRKTLWVGLFHAFTPTNSKTLPSASPSPVSHYAAVIWISARLTKGLMNSPSRNDANVCTRLALYLQIIYQKKGGFYSSIYAEIHVTGLHMGHTLLTCNFLLLFSFSK